MFLIQGTLQSYRSLADKSIRITFDTMEADAELAQRIFGCHQKHGNLYFKAGEEAITKDETETVDGLGVETEKRREIRKSKSKQLRDIIYQMWQRDNEGLDSETHYQKRMDNIMAILKDKYLDR